MRFASQFFCFAILNFLILSIPSYANEFDPPVAGDSNDPARAFDFWLGEWDVNLRVKQDDQRWADERTATAKIYSVLGGRAILELWDEDTPGDAIRGFSLRYYDETDAEWKLYLNWAGHNRSGISGLAGSFRHGRGEFFSEYAIDDSTTMLKRYTFSDITENSLRWDDAFSTDAGKTWTNNWIMEFTRTADSASWPAPGEPAHTYYDGGRCDLPAFDLVKKFPGNWAGVVTGRFATCAWEHRTHAILDGCAAIMIINYHDNFDETGHIPEIGFFSYNTYAGMYEYATLSGEVGGQFQSHFGTMVDGRLILMSQKSAPSLRRYTIELSETKLDITREDFESYSLDMIFGWDKIYTTRFKR